jgi:hypothetical protein
MKLKRIRVGKTEMVKMMAMNSFARYSAKVASFGASFMFRRNLAYLLSFGNKPWESLARKLKDEGYHSQYLDRLTRKVALPSFR